VTQEKIKILLGGLLWMIPELLEVFNAFYIILVVGKKEKEKL